MLHDVLIGLLLTSVMVIGGRQTHGVLVSNMVCIYRTRVQVEFVCIGSPCLQKTTFLTRSWLGYWQTMIFNCLHLCTLAGSCTAT